MLKIQEVYEELWRNIIRPVRDEYAAADLGQARFRLDGRVFERSDFEVVNETGEILQCSHYEPAQRPLERLPCVIYLHGNCSSRLEASDILPLMLPLNVTVVGFDFSGSGMSDGEWVTLGWRERADLACVIDHLREHRRILTVGLWGRSMGAVTALLYAQQDKTVMGVVADSAFANLRQLAEELSGNILPFKMPGFVVSGVINMLRTTILAKCGLDIDKLDPLGSVHLCVSPVAFVTGASDNFIQSHHSTALFERYVGRPKWLIEARGDHNSPRSAAIRCTLCIFMYHALQCPTLFDAVQYRNRAWEELSRSAPAVSLLKSADAAHVAQDAVLSELPPAADLSHHCADLRAGMRAPEREKIFEK